MGNAIVGKICGKELTAGDVEAIRAAVREADPPLRAGYLSPTPRKGKNKGKLMNRLGDRSDPTG